MNYCIEEKKSRSGKHRKKQGEDPRELISGVGFDAADGLCERAGSYEV